MERFLAILAKIYFWCNVNRKKNDVLRSDRWSKKILEQRADGGVRDRDIWKETR